MIHSLKTVAQNNFFDCDKFVEYAREHHAAKIDDPYCDPYVTTWWLISLIDGYRTFRGTELTAERARHIEKHNEYLRTCY